MKVIGITGGVGSGKSAVMDVLHELTGCTVIKADEVGHQLMKRGTACFDAIVETFGRSVVGEDGELSRGAIAAIVFSDPAALAKQNAIMHPAIKNRILEIIAGERTADKAYCFVEAALFFEDHYEEFCDEAWYVYADLPIRRERLKSTRGYSEEKIDAILAKQMSEEAYVKRCQRKIDNSGTLEETEKALKELL